MDTAELDYDLPPTLIAQTPIEPRDAARLLVDLGPGTPPDHRHVRDLPSLVGPGDLIVVNDTRVLPARLHLRKPTGGAVEVTPADMPAFKVPRTPGISPEIDAAMAPAPHIGEHGRAILAELGLDDAAVARLAAEKVVALP